MKKVKDTGNFIKPTATFNTSRNIGFHRLESIHLLNSLIFLSSVRITLLFYGNLTNKKNIDILKRDFARTRTAGIHSKKN